MVCGLECPVLEQPVEQGVFWRNDWTEHLLPNYALVVRPDTGAILLVNGHWPFMSLFADENEVVARSLHRAAARAQ